jgi:hypothetical protein
MSQKGRNPLAGRHFAGTPIGRSGIKPKPRTGSPSGNFVGGGVNSKTGARAEYKPKGTPSSQNYTTQAENITKQAPEPFRNKAFGAVPTVPSTKESGTNKAYRAVSGSRVSIAQDGNGALGGKPAAVGIRGSGMGSENGKVAGLKQPRRVGAPGFPKGSKKPSFYGR